MAREGAKFLGPEGRRIAERVNRYLDPTRVSAIEKTEAGDDKSQESPSR
jgi:hypothetical protein